MDQKYDRSAWLKGPGAPCEFHPEFKARPLRVVLLGAPGVGKGTQAGLLASAFGMCHLSTGDIFRAAKSLSEGELSPAMQVALDYMKRGDLVPDGTVLDMIGERMACLRCQTGFLLDGFPRTIVQAEALDKLLKSEDLELDAVLNYEIDLEKVVARLGGRRTCSSCKAVYHLETMPSKVDGVCDRCGADLILREDDRPESIRVRMAAYSDATAPLIGFYEKRGKLMTIQAIGTPEEIFNTTLQMLNARFGEVEEVKK